MATLARIVVFVSEDPKVQESVRAELVASGARIREFAVQPSAESGKEIYTEVLLDDRGLLDRLVSRIESLKGAAVMAATVPRETKSLRQARR